MPLPDQLVKARVAHGAVAVVIDVNPSSRAWWLPVNAYPEADGGVRHGGSQNQM